MLNVIKKTVECYWNILQLDIHYEALWLVTENKLAGARNGEKMVQLAETVVGK